MHAQKPSINELLDVAAKLRPPEGCPWDREQDHLTLRFHAVEEVYELMDAIEAHDDHEMMEELGDLLLQVVFHCQLARERGAFDFEKVTRQISEKLIRRHPHVFGDTKVKDVEGVWTQWDKIKRAEKDGTRHARPSALDGIPRHLPALLRAEKLLKKARKAGLVSDSTGGAARRRLTKAAVAREAFRAVGIRAGERMVRRSLLRKETQSAERALRRQERAKG